MKRILVLTNSDMGMYKFRKELLLELLQEYEVYISVPVGEYTKELSSIGCRILESKIDRRRINPVSDIQLISHYLKIIKQTQPEYVITYTVKPNIYGGLLCRVHGIKHAANITGLGTAYHKGGIMQNLLNMLYRLSLWTSKIVFFENDNDMRTLVKGRVVKAETACKLNGAGVNLEEFAFTGYPEMGNQTRFVFIGRVMKEKGILELLRVAQRVKADHPDIHFDIVGPDDGSIGDDIKGFQKEGIIKYYGFQKDVRPFIRKANCIILPSYHEGLANILLESAAIGRPLITSNIWGCKEAVNGRNGYLCGVKDIECLYDKVVEFSKLSYEKKVLMGVESRKHVERFFNRDEVVATTLRMLRDRCGEKGQESS